MFLLDVGMTLILSQVVNDAAILEPPKPIVKVVPRDTRSEWVERVRKCIIHRESRGNYLARNRHSTASGAYQFLDGTWHSVTGLPGSAADYSRSQQDAAFYKLFNNGKGRSNWYWAGHRQCW